jgi:hypothetical protein
MEGLFEGGAAVLLEGFLGDEEGDDLAFGHGEGGEGGDLAGVVESAVEGAILEGEVHAVAHEVHIALDGLGRDLEFVGEGVAIGVGAALDEFVEAKHAGEWRAGFVGPAGEATRGLARGEDEG